MWVAVAVSSYQALPQLEQLLLPGVVLQPELHELVIDNVGYFICLPLISVIFAILVGATIEQLWSRQCEIERELTEETTTFAELVSALLWALRTDDNSLATWNTGTELSQRRESLLQLVSKYGAYLALLVNGERDDLRSTDQEVRGKREVLREALKELWALQDLLALPAGGLRELLLAPARTSSSLALPAGSAAALARCQELMEKLAMLRAKREFAQEETVPLLVWVTLYSLAASLVITFCLVAIRPGHGYVCHSWRMRCMFATICTGCVALHRLLHELADPFSGSFCVTRSAACRIGCRALAHPRQRLERALSPRVD